MNRHGQALVELALLLPILLLLVVGCIEFGRGFFLKNMAINAAREGARKAVVSSGSNWKADIETAARNAVTSSSIREPIGISPGSAPSIKGQEVQVTVKIKFNTIVPHFMFPFKNVSSVSGSATMRYEGG